MSHEMLKAGSPGTAKQLTTDFSKASTGLEKKKKKKLKDTLFVSCFGVLIQKIYELCCCYKMFRSAVKSSNPIATAKELILPICPPKCPGGIIKRCRNSAPSGRELW